ncbi:MAG: RNA methyltransferase [Chloroflexi bacterium]|nr:MAG: RNA methyltransferase [Chloroflexota bacterium]
MADESNWRGVVEMLRRVATPKGRAASGFYSIEGIRLHERALRASVPIQQVVVGESWEKRPFSRTHTLLQTLKKSNTPVTIVPDAVMDGLVNGRSLGSILSLIKLPQLPTIFELIAEADPPLLLVAVDVVDPGNVGAMVRTAHASGCTALVTVGVSDPFHPKAVRNSMGSIFKLPIVSYKDVADLLTDLHSARIERVGTAVTGGTPLPNAKFEKGAAVLLGNEYFGLPDDLTTQLDTLVTIPMVSGIDSFSVNAAAAIILYEIQRNNEL